MEKEVAVKLGTAGYHGDELGAALRSGRHDGRRWNTPSGCTAHAEIGCPHSRRQHGHVGYLTVINLNEMLNAHWRAFMAGEYRTEKRMMLDVAVHDEQGENFECSVLNGDLP